MIKKQRTAQRNITPNFIIMKSTSRTKVGKNGQKLTLNKQKSQDPHQPTRTDRSSSRNSKCSLETYQRRVLHLSKLKNSLVAKQKGQEINDPLKINGNKTFDTKRTTSNPKQKPGRQNNLFINRKSGHYDNSLTRKKNSGSGKISYKAASKSHSKRDQQSLEKQDQRAKLMNVDLMTNLTKNSHTPNYIHQLKLKKTQNVKKKQSNRNQHKLLNLEVNVRGSEALNQYQIYGQLGKGAYGVVRMGVNKITGQKVAIKLYQKKHLSQLNRAKNLQREVNILAKLDHPVIAKLLDTIQTSTQIYLVLEYGGANSLYNYLLSKPQHRMKQTQAKQFLLTISQTIRYLHNNNIVHRDIKAQNILINRYKELKLIDFGFSIHSIPPDTIDTFCGTPTYMAPQIVSKIDHVPVYTDMWSLGILFYVMLQGNYPFRSKDENQLFEKIRRGRFQYIHSNISKNSRFLIQSLLRVDPYKRWTIGDLLSEKFANFFEDACLDQS